MKLASRKLIATLLISLVAAFISISAAFANFDAPIEQTVPTRTPVPQPTDPPEPTSPPSNNNDNNNNNNNNSPPPPTSTPTETPYIKPTVISEVVNLDQCGDPFFVAAFGGVNIRSVPSTDGEIVGKMEFLDKRQVLARSSEESWWQVLQPDTTTGWVFDGAGEMIGMLERVRVINPDGSTVDQITWQPTPDLLCPTLTPSPSPTATSTPEPTQTATPEPTATATVEAVPTQSAVAAKPSQSNDDGSGEVESMVEEQPEPISALPDIQEDPVEIAEVNTQPIGADFEESVATPSSSPPFNFNWPILAGIGLIIFGAIALIIQRRQSVEIN